MEEIIAAVIGGLAFGFAAIPHCYGMCGPLHISVCALNRTQSLRSLTLFNLGRISGYTMAGILFGGLGEFINIGPSNYCCQLDIFPFRGALLALLFPGVMMFWIGYMGWKKKGIPVPKTGWLSRFLTGGGAKLAAGGTVYDLHTLRNALCCFCFSGRLWKLGHRWTFYGFICHHPDVLYAIGYFYGPAAQSLMERAF